jgi:asparagine synthase (glutamine-hydrolysing)
MCGLVALLSRDQPLSLRALERGVSALAHRGPDGRSSWLAEDGRVALGHTRLSLIDPGAEQPVTSEDRNLRAIVNGEFYDHARLRRDLMARGHVLTTRSDSELIVHLYEERGIECLALLRGEFAFILWDHANRTLIAARDRFGVKPLFYSLTAGVLYLASEIKALLAAGVPAAWDEESVYQSLHLCFDSGRSLFDGIRQIPPAHVLVATPSGTRLERYWDVPYPDRSAGEKPRGEARLVDVTRGLLEEAVRLRLEADWPVGCLLSGGVDSSTVLGLAARHSSRPIVAFTIGFDGASYDETSAAQTAAAHSGAELHVVRVSDQALADHFEDSVVQGEMFQLNAHGTARFILSRSIADAGWRSVLGGEGADELFAGYAFLRSFLRAGSSRWPSWLVGAFRLLRSPTPSQAALASVSPWLSRALRLLEPGRSASDTLLRRLRLMRGLLAPDFLERFAERDPYRELFDTLNQAAGLRRWEPAKAVLYLWLRTFFASYHMAADRLDMAHAVEVRLPYLDHVLFETIAQVPAAVLSKDGVNKHLLREVARPYVAEASRRRVKQPFLARPVAAMPGEALHELVQDTLRGPLPSFISRRSVVALLDGPAPADLQAIEALLLTLTSLTILDQYYVSRSAD